MQGLHGKDVGRNEQRVDHRYLTKAKGKEEKN